MTEGNAVSDGVPEQCGSRAQFFSHIPLSDWNNWKWQIGNRIKSISDLQRIINLIDDEKQAIAQIGNRLSVGITPYYASLINPDNPQDPIRRMTIPSCSEFVKSIGESDDPLNEDHDMPVPNIVHRYPDRVLFLVTNTCATNCRYCTRSRFVQKKNHCISEPQYEAAIKYISDNPNIRDVLISGGDPLTLSDSKLEWILSNIKQIKHVEFIRIGTKVPVVLPQRITPRLVNMIRKYNPVWLSIHFMHPTEITPEVTQACNRLADAGIPLGSQTVLAKGINDNVETMKKLMHGLLKIRCRPYYIYSLDPIFGSSHFKASIQKGLEIIEGMRGHTTGYAVPNFVIDAPGGGGKIPIAPNYVKEITDKGVILRNYENKEFFYPDFN